MAVKRCPSCGDLYLAAVDVCADCGETLVEVEAEPTTGEGGPTDDASDFDEWDLAGWTMESRRLLDGMLVNTQIPRSWQGSTLFTARDSRSQVDDLVAQVGVSEAGVGEGDTVGYEVSDWTDDALDRLVALLQRDRVPYRWDPDGDLEVGVEHEEVVDAIFGELSGESPPANDGDDEGDEDDEEAGMEGHQTLSEIFLAADRLARNPADASAPASLIEAHGRMADLALPFGFSPQMWSAVADQAGALADKLADTGTPSDDVAAAAARVRDLLRDYV